MRVISKVTVQFISLQVWEGPAQNWTVSIKNPVIKSVMPAAIGPVLLLESLDV